MKITYLIGNGFDLNLGLETSYKNFYNYYLKLPTENIFIKRFKEDLSENIDTWSDLEKEIGEYTKKFSKAESKEFISLIDDIQDALAEYLKLEQDFFEPYIPDYDIIYDDLFNPGKYFTEKEKSYIEAFMRKHKDSVYELGVIIFNYTNTFEKIIDWKGRRISTSSHSGSSRSYENVIKNVEHIHGTVDKDMLMGVNDSSQISNFDFRDNLEINETLVKPKMNELTGSYREENCEKAILQSDIICIFGMSLGITDKKWWELINKRISEVESLVLFFCKDDSIKQIRSFRDKRKKDSDLKNKLLSFNENFEIASIMFADNILISYNSKMLKINNQKIKIPANIKAA